MCRMRERKEDERDKKKGKKEDLYAHTYRVTRNKSKTKTSDPGTA